MLTDPNQEKLQAGDERAIADFIESLGPINPVADKVVFEGLNSDLPTDGFDWVLDLEQYKNWEAGRGVPVFWIQDGTGAGHTPLTLKLLDWLVRSGRENGALMVAYCFCQRNAQTQRTIADALQGLLTTIFQQNTDILTHIRGKHSSLLQKLSKVDTSEHFIFEKLLTDTLSELVTRGREICLVIDGLDTLVVDPTSYDANRILRSLISRFPSIKWIITSRQPPSHLWTCPKPSPFISELVLSTTEVTKALSLEEAITIIMNQGKGLRRIYEDSIPSGESLNHLSWFEHTTRGRQWLTRPSFPNGVGSVVWYRSSGGKTIPCDLSLSVLQKVHEWQSAACFGAYFSFSFVRPPRHQHAENPLLNPIPALWCLFAQLACEKYSTVDELAIYILTLPKEQQASLREICVVVRNDRHDQLPDAQDPRFGHRIWG